MAETTVDEYDQYRDDGFHDRLKQDWPHDPEQLHAGGWEITKSVINDLLNRVDGVSKVKLLDLSCGEGSTAIYLAKEKVAKPWEIVGVDISELAIKRAQSIAKENKLGNVSFQCCNALDMPFEDNTFHLVLGQDPDVLAHEGRFQSMKETFRVTKPGYYFAFHHHWIPARGWDPKVLAEYAKKSGSNPETNGDNYIKDLERAGFELVEVEDMEEIAKTNLKGQYANMQERVKEKGGEIQEWLKITNEYIDNGHKFGLKVLARKPE